MSGERERLLGKIDKVVTEIRAGKLAYPLSRQEADRKRQIYAETAKGLRELGWDLLALVIEEESLILFGDPGLPEPVGMLAWKMPEEPA